MKKTFVVLALLVVTFSCVKKEEEKSSVSVVEETPITKSEPNCGILNDPNKEGICQPKDSCQEEKVIADEFIGLLGGIKCAEDQVCCKP